MVDSEEDPLSFKINQSLQSALNGQKVIRLANTLDEGLDQTVLDIPQEIWYKYPSMGEDFIKSQLEARGIRCVRPFPNSHRDRIYTHDHLIWKMMADKYIEHMEEEPLFFCYKNSTNLDEVCKEYGLRHLMPDYKLFKELQYKTNLPNYGVEEGAGLVPFFEENIKELTYSEIQKRLNTKHFVVQYSFHESGWNTCGCNDTNIVKSAEHFDLLQKEITRTTPAKISKFIEGYGLCVNVINTEKGPIIADPYIQAIKKEGHNVTDLGVNFTQSETFISEKAREKVKVIARNIGNALYKKNFKGHFGVDLLWEKETDDIFVLEINPRFTGSTNNQTFLAEKSGKVPLIAIHLCEYLECLPESFNIEQYEESIRGIWKGGGFYMVSQEDGKRQIEEAPHPGIYKINADNTITFKKEAYSLCDLPSEKDHFLVKQVYPLKRNIIPGRADIPLCLIYSPEQVYDEDKDFLDRYKQVKKELYKLFKFVPEGTYFSSLPYDVF